MNTPAHVKSQNCEIRNSLYGTKIQIINNDVFGLEQIPEDIYTILTKNGEISALGVSIQDDCDNLSKLISNISELSCELFSIATFKCSDSNTIEKIVNEAIINLMIVGLIPKLNGKMIPASCRLDLESFSCHSKDMLDIISESYTKIISLNRHQWLCREAMLSIKDKNLFNLSKILYEFKCELSDMEKFKSSINSFYRNNDFELIPYFNDHYRYH